VKQQKDEDITLIWLPPNDDIDGGWGATDTTHESREFATQKRRLGQ